jgi:hypothetical protein
MTDETGEGPEMWIIEKIPEIIFLGIALSTIVLVTFFFIMNNLETNQTEISVFFNRMIYSENGISYHDTVSGRTFMGIIDIDKLDSSKLEQSIQYPSDRLMAAKLTLGTRKPVYYHEGWYENFEALGKSGLRGLGGVDYVKKDFYVTYIENGTFDSAILRIEIVRPRS